MHLLAHNFKSSSETFRVYAFRGFNFHDHDPIASRENDEDYFLAKNKRHWGIKKMITRTVILTSLRLLFPRLFCYQCLVQFSQAVKDIVDVPL